MSDVEALRHTVEGESDQRLVSRSRFPGMLQGSFQQFIPDATTLLGGIDEELGEKPDIAAHPTPGKTEDFASILRHP